jgi:hypothetical protein
MSAAALALRSSHVFHDSLHAGDRHALPQPDVDQFVKTWRIQRSDAADVHTREVTCKSSKDPAIGKWPMSRSYLCLSQHVTRGGWRIRTSANVCRSRHLCRPTAGDRELWKHWRDRRTMPDGCVSVAGMASFRTGASADATSRRAVLRASARLERTASPPDCHPRPAIRSGQRGEDRCERARARCTWSARARYLCVTTLCPTTVDSQMFDNRYWFS